MKQIRASYSFLNLWQQGQIHEALLSYFHVPHPTPASYVNGRRWDDYCQDYITRHKTLPPEWGGDKLKAPVVQMKTLVPYNALCTFTGVYDIYDNKTIYELKSGHSNSARQYAGAMQVPLYLLLASLAGTPVTRAMVIRYNPKTDSYDRALLYPSRQIYARARNYIDSIIPEVHKYFEDNGLFEKTDAEIASQLHSL